MTNKNDAYWDDLGIAWTAIAPDAQSLVPRLQWRLRLQTLFTSAAFFLGLPVSLAGCLLGAWTVWRGIETQAWFFVTRGIAIVAIALIAAFAVTAFKSGLRDNAKSLAAMIELALLRAQLWQRVARLGCLALGIANLFGLIGYGIRLQMGKAQAVPVVEPLILSAGLGLLLFLLERRAQDQSAKFRHLKRMLEE